MGVYVKMTIPRKLWLDILKFKDKSSGYYYIAFTVPSCTPTAYVDTPHGRVWAKSGDTVSVPVHDREIMNLQKQYNNLMTKNIHGRKMVVGYDFPLIITGCVVSDENGNCIYGNTYDWMFMLPGLGGGPQPGSEGTTGL